MKEKILSVFLIFSLVLANVCMTVSYAAPVEITDESLNTSLQKAIATNGSNYTVVVENNKIIFTTEDGEFTINYDLTNKPTFAYEANIMQGMTYKDFQAKTNNVTGLMVLCYIAVADIQGVPYEDASVYMLMNLLNSTFSSLSENATENIIVINDVDLPEGFEIIKDPNDTTTLYASEFGDHVMEYTNSVYKEKQTTNDAGSFNTFEMTMERKDITETSCKIVTTLTVNTDADFSPIIGLTKAMANPFETTKYKIINGQGELAGETLIVDLGDKTTAQDLKNNISLANIYQQEGCYIKLFNIDDKELANNDLVGTGTYGQIYTSEDEPLAMMRFRVILYGDTTGDGKVNVADALAIVKNKLGKITFENEYFVEAGRISKTTRNKRSTPGVADALMTIKHKLKKVMIEQYY